MGTAAKRHSWKVRGPGWRGNLHRGPGNFIHLALITAIRKVNIYRVLGLFSFHFCFLAVILDNPSVLSREKGNSMGSSIDLALVEPTTLIEDSACLCRRLHDRTNDNPNSTTHGTTTAAAIVPVFLPLSFACDVGSSEELPVPEFGRGFASAEALDGGRWTC